LEARIEEKLLNFSRGESGPLWFWNERRGLKRKRKIVSEGAAMHKKDRSEGK